MILNQYPKFIFQSEFIWTQSRQSKIHAIVIKIIRFVDKINSNWRIRIDFDILFSWTSN
jgi:hypothetical protein